MPTSGSVHAQQCLQNPPFHCYSHIIKYTKYRGICTIGAFTIIVLSIHYFQGIQFVESLASLWKEKALNENFFEAECTHWLTLLIGIVDVTEDHKLLEKFLVTDVGVCKKYRKHVFLKVRT